MTLVYLGVGSNVEREQHLRRGLDALQQLLGPLELSPVFESDCVGVIGRRFLNMVVGARTHMPLADLQAALKSIEAACGRREHQRRGQVTLDIDILTFGQLTGSHEGITLPRPETLRNAFVLWPLALLSPRGVLPGGALTHAQLWTSWDGQQALWPVAFEWQGQQLTSPGLVATYRPLKAR